MLQSLRSFIAFTAVIACVHAVAAEMPNVRPPSFYLRRQMNYVQTGPQSLEERDGILSVFIDAHKEYSPAGFALEMQVAGATYPMETESKEIRYPCIFAKHFDTRAAMEAAFPTAAVVKITQRWASGDTFSSYVQIPAHVPPKPPLTNFDAAQNWTGGPLALAWDLAPMTPYSAGPDAPQVGIGWFNLNIYRAANIDTENTGDSLFTVRYADQIHGITADTVKAAPGETLYGEFRIFFAPYALFPVGWVRFPIHRVSPMTAPVLTLQPESRVVRAGENVTLRVGATGSNLAYQWKKNGVEVPGATTDTLGFASVQPADSGSYVAVVANAAGQVVSDAATITVVVLPTITAAPVATSVRAGEKAVVSVSASGSAPLGYQWQRDGKPIAGATQATFTLDSTRLSDSGQYAVTVSNAWGAVTSAAVEVKVNAISRIVNLSILTSLTSASDNFRLGFVLKGSGLAQPNGAAPILIRAVGPSLAAFGITDGAVDPKLELFNGAVSVIANDNWGGEPDLANAFAAAGAFAFSNASTRDAAVLARVSTASNSITISGTGSGRVLAEFYDVSPAGDFNVSSPRLVNVSVLKEIGAGLTAGFVVEGPNPVRLLVRAVGPSLAALGVTGFVVDPQLSLFQSGSETPIVTNDNWSNVSEVTFATNAVGAFPLAAGSKDAVLLVTLSPGSYTARVTGIGSTTGTAIVEIYEVP